MADGSTLTLTQSNFDDLGFEVSRSSAGGFLGRMVRSLPDDFTAA